MSDRSARRDRDLRARHRDRGYLTYVHYAGVSPVCEIAHGEGPDVQLVGGRGVPSRRPRAIGYAGILAALFVPGETGLIAAAGEAVVGVGFSVYLTYREVFTIEAICIWCVASAILMAALAMLTVLRLARQSRAAPSAPPAPPSSRTCRARRRPAASTTSRGRRRGAGVVYGIGRARPAA